MAWPVHDEVKICFKAVLPHQDGLAETLGTMCLDDIVVSESDHVLTLYSDNKMQLESIVAQLGFGAEAIQQISDESWRDQWAVDLEPLDFGSFRIVPKRKEFESDIVIAPGRSFGIGHHPTTHLMLELMRDHSALLRSKIVFDFGCGSGVLGIAAAKCGAQQVYGCDIEEEAVSVANLNAVSNKLLNCEFFVDNQPRNGFHVLLLNVLEVTARDNISVCREQLLANRGAIFCSGYLVERNSSIIKDLGISIIESRSRDDWGACVGTIFKSS